MQVNRATLHGVLCLYNVDLIKTLYPPQAYEQDLLFVAHSVDIYIYIYIAFNYSLSDYAKEETRFRRVKTCLHVGRGAKSNCLNTSKPALTSLILS
jgi:hypothetical protein